MSLKNNKTKKLLQKLIFKNFDDFSDEFWAILKQLQVAFHKNWIALILIRYLKV